MLCGNKTDVEILMVCIDVKFKFIGVLILQNIFQKYEKGPFHESDEKKINLQIENYSQK